MLCARPENCDLYYLAALYTMYKKMGLKNNISVEIFSSLISMSDLWHLFIMCSVLFLCVIHKVWHVCLPLFFSLGIDREGFFPYRSTLCSSVIFLRSVSLVSCFVFDSFTEIKLPFPFVFICHLTHIELSTSQKSPPILSRLTESRTFGRGFGKSLSWVFWEIAKGKLRHLPW